MPSILLSGPAGAGKSQVAGDLLREATEPTIQADFQSIVVALLGLVRGPGGRYPVRPSWVLPITEFTRQAVITGANSRGLSIVATTSDGSPSRRAALLERPWGRGQGGFGRSRRRRCKGASFEPQRGARARVRKRDCSMVFAQIGPEPEFASWAAICDGMKWPPAGSRLLTSRFASSRHFSLLQKRILSMKRHRDEHDLGERWSWTHDEFDLLRNRTDSGPITT